MEIAYEADPNKSYSLLEKRNKRWGGRNFMQLGYIGHLRTFIASESSKITRFRSINWQDTTFYFRPNLSECGQFQLDQRFSEITVVLMSPLSDLALFDLDAHCYIHGMTYDLKKNQILNI